MKLNNVLRQMATTLKTYIDKVVPKKLSDLEIDMEIGNSGVSSWNDLTDKPFGEMEVPVIVVSEKTYNNGENLSFQLPQYDGFRRSGVYKITIDNDDVYLCEMIGGYAQHMGNANFSEYPFFAQCRDSVGTYIYFQDGNSHVFKIEYLESQIVTIDEVFIPSEIARVSDIPEQIQADYNQNDETAVDYIKNKTHYTTIDKKQIILPKVTITENNQTIAASNLTPTFNGYPNTYFYLLINDQVYYESLSPAPTFPSKIISKSGSAPIWIHGNLHLYSEEYEDNGYPFCTYKSASSSNAVVLLKDPGNVPMTIEMFQGNINYHTLDEKFIPDIIARTADVLASANQNSLDQSYSPIVDSDLTTKSYVDAHIPTEDDLLALVVELGLIEPVMESDGVFYTAENDAIYIF